MDHSKLIPKIRASIALVVAVDAKNQPMGTGSGFIFADKTIVVTCHHVIKGSNSILLKFSDETNFISCKLVVSDHEHDLALLKFDNTTRNPLPLADLSTVAEGMPVVFSGYPFSMKDLTTHQGIISAIIKDATGITSYVIDGTVNSGNSGCPLMDVNGNVLGVVNAKRRNDNDLLERIENMPVGALALHQVDIVQVYRALAGNIQLGMGYAVPASYIPTHKEIK